MHTQASTLTHRPADLFKHPRGRLPPDAHTPGGGEGGGGPGEVVAGWDARTFTAATFFAHLLTLRMFRVYFFNPVTLRKKMKRARWERGNTFFWWSSLPLCFFFIYKYIYHFYLFFFFLFVLTVTPAWNPVIPTGTGVGGHFAWRVHVQEAVHTYFFAFTTAKLKMMTEASHKQCHYRFSLSLSLSHSSHTGAQTKSVDV